MTEHTDKASEKSGKTAPGKRPAKSRAPKGKKATAPGVGDGTASPAKKSAAKKPADRPAAPAYQAPDPATIVFGSNRPIVAAPQKMPESSGLKFSGPSLGKLKSSGPQPSSPKASGLTFSTAGSTGGTTAGTGKPAAGAQSTMKALPPKPKAARPAAAGSGEQKGPEARQTEAAKGEAAKVAGTAKPPTKPAIAPQASGRRLEKERSSAGFVATFVALAVVVGGLAVWINQTISPKAPPAGQQVAIAQAPSPQAETPAAAPPAPGVAEPVVLGPSPRAPVSPGPLAALPDAPVVPAQSAGTAAGLSTAQISEIQKLLARLDLAPGNTDGVLTPACSANCAAVSSP